MFISLPLLLALASPLSASEPPSEPSPHGSVRAVAEDAVIRVIEGHAGKPVPSGAEDWAREHELPAGAWTIALRRPEHVPIRGSVTVEAGRTVHLSAELSPIESASDGEIWSIISLSAGLAMLATAGIIETAGVDDSEAVDNAEAVLVSVGAAAFITGGILTYWLRGKRIDPEPREGEFVLETPSVGVMDSGATLQLRGRF